MAAEMGTSDDHVVPVPPTSRQATVLMFLRIVLEHHRLLLGTVVVVLLITVGVVLLGLRDHTVTSRFMPNAPNAETSRLAGLAAQFGLPVGGLSSDRPSVDFYAALLESPGLLREVALTEYRFAEGPGEDTLAGTFLDLYEIEGNSPQRRLEAGVRLLDQLVSAGVDVRANLVELHTTARWHELAAQMNRRILDLVNEFNLRDRQTQAGAERRFVETRMEEARGDLETAEKRLEEFLDANRRYQDSPQLVFEYARLQRRVEIQQQVYISLAQSYEQARIEEVRNTPVITVVDDPEDAMPEPRRLLRAAALGGILGIMAGVFLVFAAEYLRREREADPGAYATVRSLIRQIAARYVPVRRGRGSDRPS